MTAMDKNQDVDVKPLKAEEVLLWLPSDLDVDSCLSGCATDLADMEAKLHKVQLGFSTGNP